MSDGAGSRPQLACCGKTAAGAAVFVVMSGRSPLWAILVGPMISVAAAQF